MALERLKFYGCGVSVDGLKKLWHVKLDSLRSECQDIRRKYPDEGGMIKHVCKVLEDTVSLARCTPANVIKSAAWTSIVDNAKEDRINFCMILKWKQLFSYALTLTDLRSVLQASARRDLPCQVNKASLWNEGKKRQHSGFKGQGKA